MSEAVSETVTRPATRRAAPPLRIGIVGAGDIVRAVHLPTLQAVREANVEWLCDLDEGRCRSMSRAYGPAAQPLPANPADLPPADVVLLATPYGVRRGYFEALRERAVAIYVEKPFARTAELHRELCSWFPPYSLASGLMMRAWGPSALVREAVETKLFGPLRQVRFGFGKPGLVTHGRYYFDRRRGGAGMLFEVGIHGIDTLLHVSGAKRFDLQHVHAVQDDGLDLHTDAELTLVTGAGEEIGCQITVTSLEDTIEGVELEFEYAVVSYPLVGQGYSLVGEAVDWRPLVRPKGRGRSYRLLPGEAPLAPLTKFQMFGDYWRLFLQGFADRQANAASAIDALLTTELIEQLYERGRQGGRS